MNLYQLFKAIHIIFMVAWFAGLFYIFRLYVYHIQNFDKPELTKVYAVMERRLIFVIMFPAMILTFLFGILMLAMAPTLIQQTWFLVKLAGICLLLAYHFYAVSVQSRLEAGEKPLTARACRFINEVPTVLLIVIVLVAVLKPWV